MAEVNKSQAIRDYFKSNKKAKTREVVDALGKQAYGHYQPCRHRQVHAQQAAAGGEEGGCQGRRGHPRDQSGPGFHQAHGERCGGKTGPESGPGDQKDRVALSPGAALPPERPAMRSSGVASLRRRDPDETWPPFLSSPGSPTGLLSRAWRRTRRPPSRSLWDWDGSGRAGEERVWHRQPMPSSRPCRPEQPWHSVLWPDRSTPR